MSIVQRNSRVTLHYRLGLTDDQVFEDNFNEAALTVQLGCGEMAEGLELALIGLKPGDEQTIDIGPELAFGFIEHSLYRSISRSEFEPILELELELGLIIEFSTEQGNTLPGTIIGIDDDEVRVDLNHPLAGQTVRYSVKIVAVEDNPETIH